MNNKPDIEGDFIKEGTSNIGCAFVLSVFIICVCVYETVKLFVKP